MPFENPKPAFMKTDNLPYKTSELPWNKLEPHEIAGPQVARYRHKGGTRHLEKHPVTADGHRHTQCCWEPLGCQGKLVHEHSKGISRVKPHANGVERLGAPILRHKYPNQKQVLCWAANAQLAHPAALLAWPKDPPRVQVGKFRTTRLSDRLTQTSPRSEQSI